jgi:hypothetical protein
MRYLVALGILLACSSREVPAARQAPGGWIVESPDGVFSVEVPVASTPDAKIPHFWQAITSPDDSYNFGYMDFAGAQDRLDDVVGTITTGFFKTSDRIEKTTILGHPARRIWGTTPANRSARALLVANGDRLFVLHVIGPVPPANIERFLGSLEIH